MSVPVKRIPKELLEIPAISVFAFASSIIIFVVVISVACISVFNLIHYSEITTFEKWGSITWLIIVVMTAVSLIAEAGGASGFLTNILGAFSSQRIIEVNQQGDGTLLLSYGYEIYGRRFNYFQINTKFIAMVSWSAWYEKQAPDMNNRNWGLSIWSHRRGEPKTLDPKNLHRKKCHIVVSYMTGHRCTELGNSLIALLKDVGVPLESTAREFEYVVDQEDDVMAPTAST